MVNVAALRNDQTRSYTDGMATFTVPAISLAQQAVRELTIARERFNRSTHNLTDAMSGFAPGEETMSTAQQVGHTARVIDWFIEGAFRSEGFDMDFEEQVKLVMAVDSLSAAREWFEKSMDNAIQILAAQSDVDLMALLASGPVLGGMPRLGIVREIVDHTAHHRGALTVYARMKGIAPLDPYGL